jgi:hypothetical protein
MIMQMNMPRLWRIFWREKAMKQKDSMGVEARGP